MTIEPYPMPDPALFHAAEIRPVTLYRDVDGSEYYDEPAKGFPPTMWSVFGLYREGHVGSDCIGDFETKEQALEYARALSDKFNLHVYVRAA